ncbi:hypothetical protein [Humibacter ginsenosidimutans]|uniref:Uncharacterized protein n=1 Tax=Humibacter ginsenosidimutans TaxID=2599293 RepID=A0A5B8M5L4_9MICO|nr:hypothetical protein [Humibacter ginsenosidimutans]QDZ14882.1 hypothetical protein FPZ11_09020 [Humibacter ginsenosidimutans]
MSSYYDCFISGDHEAAKHLIADAVNSQGFLVEVQQDGNWLVRRGNMTSTVFVGALAGDNFQITFGVQFFQDAAGLLVARLDKNTAAGFFKGGVWGLSKIDKAFSETCMAMYNTLVSAGVLTNTAEG